MRVFAVFLKWLGKSSESLLDNERSSQVCQSQLRQGDRNALGKP